uniref:Uncharacterized protein n=1 Tax=Rhizophora mucronata TaxID=61149 RepID=A0A2P2NDD3_RHIMU
MALIGARKLFFVGQFNLLNDLQMSQEAVASLYMHHCLSTLLI